MRAVAIAAVLFATVAVAQGRSRAPAVLWVEGPIHSWNERQRDAVRDDLVEAAKRIKEALRSREHRGEARRSLKVAQDAVENVRELLDGEKKLKTIPARSDDRKRGWVRAVKTKDVVVVSIGEVDDELREADEALADVEDGFHGRRRDLRDVEEARDLLHGVHEKLLATVERNEPWKRRAERRRWAEDEESDPRVTTPVPPHLGAQPVHEPMRPHARNAFFHALDAERSHDDRFRVIEEAARTSYFLVSDIEAVMKRFDRPIHRLRTAFLLKTRIADPANTFALYAAFSSSRDKDELKRVLSSEATGLTVEAVAHDQFRRILQRTGDARDDDTALADLALEADRSYFTAQQVSALIVPFNSSMARMKAVRTLSGHVIDPQNYGVIQAKFNSALDRNAVRELFVGR